MLRHKFNANKQLRPVPTWQKQRQGAREIYLAATSLSATFCFVHSFFFCFSAAPLDEMAAAAAASATCSRV